MYDVKYDSPLFSCMLKFSCPSTSFWRDYYFPIKGTWHPCQNSINYKRRGLFLDLQFYSIGLYVYLYISTMVFRLLYLIVSFGTGKCESSVLLQDFLEGIFRDFCNSIWIWGLVFYFCKKGCWNFDKSCTESVDYFE